MKKAVAVLVALMFFLLIHIALAEQTKKSSAEFVLSIEGFYPEQEVILKPGENLSVIIKNGEMGTVNLFVEKIPEIVFPKNNEIIIPGKNNDDIICYFEEKPCAKKGNENLFIYKFTGAKKTKVRLWAGLLECKKH